MTNSEQEHTKPEEEVQLEGGTYEIIRNRLLQQNKDLDARLSKLNEARKAVFGSIDSALITTERITTEHNCSARDMVPVNSSFIFGYNVHLGLKTETQIADVFSVYQYKDHSFHRASISLINDAQFENDFKNLYKYYRDTVFTKFAVIGPYLYMVFQISKEVTDIKAFKWLIQPDGKLTYVDNRSEHEVVFPEQHDFVWVRTNRELHRSGMHPHISIEDRVFVETIGGDLTIKVEDNTNTGQGIYEEPVKNPDQTLDDAEIYYALVGNLIVMKIKPYQEKQFRYILFNEKVQEALRIDALENSCVFLPDDQGIIFAKGYYLQNGEFKLFENQLEDMLFERKLQSPNGEDFLYVFYNQSSGIYLLLSYNLIEQKVDNPIICHGFSIFQNGELCFFRGDDEQKKHHTIQIWQTPYAGEDFEIQVSEKNYLYKVGNKDLVRGLAECREVSNLVRKEDSYANLYLDLVKLSTDIIDSYYWLDKEDTFQPIVPLTAIREAASSAIDEYEKVQSIKKNTREEADRVSQKVKDIDAEIRRRRASNIDDFVQYLADLRSIRGEVISLRELRYIDLGLVESAETLTGELSDRMSKDCITFLLSDKALAPYEQKVEELRKEVEEIGKVADANVLSEKLTTHSGDLEMLIDIVSNLKIEDATQTTRIIDNISAIYSRFNQIKAALRKKRKALLGVEGKAEFNAQLKLVDQGLVNYLDLCDTPAKCDEYLTKLMVQLEELEGKFTEFDEFLEKIHEKREDIYNAFESKKLNLVESRNRRANNLQQSAERILQGIKNRLAGFTELSEINGYLASDLMVEKVRDIVNQLLELEDSVKVDDIQSRLKTIKEEAVRQLQDKAELFEDGQNIIRFGKHRFSVNKLNLDLSMVVRNDELNFHLAGTNFFEAVDSDELHDAKALWDQSLISESRDVYRAEYLTYQLLEAAANPGKNGVETLPLSRLHQLTEAELLEYVRQFMAPRYQEGYVKGVHDQDTTLLLKALVQFSQTSDLLRYPSQARAFAAIYWQQFADASHKSVMQHRLRGIGQILKAFPSTREFKGIIGELQNELRVFAEEHPLFSKALATQAGEYLFHELSRGEAFIIAPDAGDLHRAFFKHLKKVKLTADFEASIATLNENGTARYKLILNWLRAFLEEQDDEDAREFMEEVAVLIHLKSFSKDRIVQATLKTDLEGFQGNHALIANGKYHLNFNHFLVKMRTYTQETAPQFIAFTERKKTIVADYREDLRLNEFKPRVLTSFVRNKLIDEVYLPMIGANLAKQIGAAGENKRTDLMGMLLLISPPGYGKTTLMEYLASRLGIIFMKVNGPAIGHQVTSLDPDEAPNASAREELEKLNLGLEMGDNIMLYLDDIQHCNPEFLQKFISLCDAQRKIEGVFKGRSKTYDLRGKKVCVVMAGNPYTESGEKFRIPDMLANRADIYNLGDIIGDSGDVFKLSYVENCLTSNPVLSQLSSKSHKDLYTLIQLAETGEREGLEFEAAHSAIEIRDYVAVLQKLLYVRDLILRVNMEYIRSAAQADEFRTEPPFKLQGSYRNMNKIAEQIVPIMNDSELKTLILSYYENEAQTLTSGAEANMLKFKELNSLLDDTETARWEEIKALFQKNQRMRGFGSGNQMGQVLIQMESITDGLTGIRDALASAPEEQPKEADPSTNTETQP